MVADQEQAQSEKACLAPQDEGTKSHVPSVGLARTVNRAHTLVNARGVRKVLSERGTGAQTVEQQ